MTLALVGSHRTRCSSHALFLDDRGRCLRCDQELAAVEGRRAFGVILRLSLVVGAFIIMVGAVLHGYRIVTSMPREAAVAAKASVGEKKLLVYSTKTCPACRVARAYMNGHDIAYEERDVEEPAARAEFLALGSRGVPTFVVDGEVMTGFDPRGVVLESALKRHGMR